MRVVRGWRWYERIFGALCGALAGLLWWEIISGLRQERQTGLSGSRQAHRKGGAKGGHQARRPISYLDRAFPPQAT
jgi:hypothetical protein